MERFGGLPDGLTPWTEGGPCGPRAALILGSAGTPAQHERMCDEERARASQVAAEEEDNTQNNGSIAYTVCGNYFVSEETYQGDFNGDGKTDLVRSAE